MLAYVTAENIMKILFVKAYQSDRLSPAIPLAATPRSGAVSIYAHLFKNAIVQKTLSTGRLRICMWCRKRAISRDGNK